MTVIEVHGLARRYDDREVLRDVNFSVMAGTVFALLGPNGAGKTTTVEILEGYRRPTGGRVSVLGVDPWRAGAHHRERIGILLQDGGVEPYLTVGEVVDATRATYPDPRPRDDVLEAVGLSDRAGITVRRLSAGQRRRLELALAVCGRPQVLFLDEPTVGFDPVARQAAWRWIRQLVSSGTTVFLTTNLMEEAQALADQLAILADGAVIARGTPGEVISGAAASTVISFRLAPGAPPPPGSIAAGTIRRAGGVFEMRTQRPVRALHELTAWALHEELQLHELSARPRSLEEAYLDLLAGDRA